MKAQDARQATFVLRLLAVLAVVALLVTMAGCGRSRPFTGKIVVWDGPRAPGPGEAVSWLEQRAQEFMRQNPGVQIEILQVAWDDMPVRLEEAFRNNAWPDVAPVRAGFGITLTDAELGRLEPVEMDAGDAGDFFPSALRALAWQSTFFALPVSMNGPVITCNADLVDLLGGATNWTWEEFRAAVQNVRDDSPPSAQSRYGFAASAAYGDQGLWPLLMMRGATFLSAEGDRLALNSEAGAAALDDLIALKFTDRSAHPLTGTGESAAMQELFTSPSRLVGCLPLDVPTLRRLSATQVDPPLRLTVLPYPSAGGAEAPAVVDVEGFAALKQQTPEKRAVVLRFVRFLASSASQAELAKVQGRFPARRSAAEAVVALPEIRRALELLAEASPLPIRPWRQIADERLNHYLALALLGERTGAEALREAARDIDFVLKDR